ncbi:MAG: M20/M25/M40 family metallo-hydrolase, partial [Flavobacteriaceae bacterium]|nr:M20/M25/M40 family metallo-hydrolase [Flavobacteriaceae bacterium]
RIAEIDGGGLRNAIPRESLAMIVVEDDEVDAFREDMDQRITDIKKELNTMEPDMDILLTRIVPPDRVMTVSTQEGLIKALYAAHNGVYRMSADIPELVETSNNIARVTVQHGQIKVSCLCRSSVESSKMDLANQLKATFELAGCDVEFTHSYPGWTPNMDSAILKVMVDLYEKLYNEKPHVAACHAGLECGILGTNYPEMDMISFGPNILGAHSPDERAQISSVQKFWKFVLEILRNIPSK